jgi:transketolase
MKTEKLIYMNMLSKKVRKHILKMSNQGGCFVGSAFSVTEIIIYLYNNFLNISLDNLNSRERDYFFLSKGHAVPALYGTFIELGWLHKSRLENHLKTNDDIYWHPNRDIQGIEFHSGSLGHSLSIATGIAIDCKLNSSPNKVVVILGDGELNEGTIWETLQIASAYKLDNLLIIVDRNRIQANERTEKLIPLDPLNLKFEAFGCSVKIVDGHDYHDIDEVLNEFPFESGRPSVVLADTTRGKGISRYENKVNKWFIENNNYELLEYFNELNDVKESTIEPGKR